MEGPRQPLESEYPRVLEFLDTQLRPNSNWSVAKEYPTALSVSNLHNIRIITDEAKQVLSHAVLKPLIVKTPLAIFKIGAIGSVVTDEAHRNQGLSKTILENCILEAKNQSCDLAMLWTDLYDFYRKMNFELAGSEISCVIEEEFEAKEAGQLKFIKGIQVSAESIYRLYSQHTVTSVRTAEEVRKFLQIPQTQCYTAWDQNNQLVAYAIEGKGADLTGYIHEWGGSVSKLMALFSFIRKEKKTPFTVILPKHSQNLITQLQQVPSVTYNEGFLGMLKIINQDSLFSKIKKAARSLGVIDFTLQRQGEEVILGCGADLIAIKDEKDLIRVLFGPSVNIPLLQEETVTKLNKFLPLPLWVWGWDSV